MLAVRAFAAGILPAHLSEERPMLTEIVTRALSQLTGSPMSGDRIKGQFQYAYASDDGQFVAILTHDMTTYVVDLRTQRYFAECGGSPRGFAGHVLEMEGAEARQHPWPAANDLFDLDMDADELSWRQCPGMRSMAEGAHRSVESRAA
ncbi:hypothetical protein AX27061_1219 [Achromobacter xylosoxidans NBRC 15126 = ATCC 27061]|nr:hypothetical protein AX27061_1219 [Achromobacter xylosoxidans NBRC 15126 = ATCC 27061]CCH04797.1 ortholog of Bordetella pertussis (BX470248) BP2496 [Achromobacter xylosoxidans NH44784-1996]